MTSPVTLEMAFGVLRAPVEAAACRCKCEDAEAVHVSSVAELGFALQH